MILGRSLSIRINSGIVIIRVHFILGIWGSLLCTTTMDKLGKLFYESDDLVYMYKGAVSVPALCMVDDILAVQKCSERSVEINSVINTFIEMKKLTLSKSKCSKIHVGKPESGCPELKIHGEKMKESKQEKYLGDMLSNTGKIQPTIDERISKGYGIVSEILALIDQVPLGKYRLEMGLKLRQAMFINGILFNSEVWHGVTDDHVRALEKVDEYLLRSLLQCHAKTPLEFLFLETGSVPIRHLISSRRMIYLQTILRRDDEEVTKRIFKEQQRNPCKGDYAKLIEKDFKDIGISYDEQYIIGPNYKDDIKQKIAETAFIYLVNKQKGHSKVLDITYEKYATQAYLKSTLFSNNEVCLLAALRSHTVRGIRSNFKNMYQNDTSCPLKCWEPGSQPVLDDQQHILTCKRLDLETDTVARNIIEYRDIYGDVSAQKCVTSLFNQKMDRREEILDEEAENPPVGNWTLAPDSAVPAQTSTFVNTNCIVPALGIK